MEKMNVIQNITILAILSFSSFGYALCGSNYSSVVESMKPDFTKAKRAYEKNYQYGQGSTFDNFAISVGLKKETKEEITRKAFNNIALKFLPLNEAMEILKSAALEGQTEDGGSLLIQTELDERNWKALVEVRESIGEKLSEMYDKNIEFKNAYNRFIVKLYKDKNTKDRKDGVREFGPVIQSYIAKLIREGNQNNQFCSNGKLSTAAEIRDYVVDKWIQEQNQFAQKRK